MQPHQGQYQTRPIVLIFHEHLCSHSADIHSSKKTDHSLVHVYIYTELDYIKYDVIIALLQLMFWHTPMWTCVEVLLMRSCILAVTKINRSVAMYILPNFHTASIFRICKLHSTSYDHDEYL